MMRIKLLILIFMGVSHFIVAQEELFYIAGQVLADNYVCETPINGAYIRMKGQQKGYITDSLGYFKIDNLQPGKYKLKFTCISCFDYDTTIVIKNASVNEVNIVLPMWYYEEAFTSQAIREEIENGYPGLYVYTSTNNMEKLSADPFWEKYKVGYRIFERELIENSRQSFSAPMPVLIRFNQEIFNYLDYAYGKKWRDEAPVDILGLDE